ncbi:MAG: hypothetical protein JWP81_4073 [Ferruginibacter sp.]|nr:hypothetical protein [Ferruginibacter sp.]
MNKGLQLLLFTWLLCLLPFTSYSQKRDYRSEMNALQHTIREHFFISSTGYYKETATTDKDSRPVSYLWPLCAVFEANNEMEKLLQDSSLAGSVFEIIRKYHNELAPAPAYASYSMQHGGGSRFYDDNQWIGITAMDIYEKTKATRWLESGKEIYRFMMTGYDTTAAGGLYWEEGNKKTKNTCSNGPGIILALQLYKATNKNAYLDTAVLLYNWVNKTLKAPSGLYYDNIKINSGRIGKHQYTYNTGTMLQSAIYLYEATNDPAYLKQATSIADSSLPYFFDTKKFKDNYWFEAVLLRGYQHLLRYNKDPKYINAFKACLDNALDSDKNVNGLMGKKRPENLVAQGGMLEILARFAWLRENNFLAEVVNDKDLFDLVVYGGTSAGVTAAVQAARMGKKVLLISSNFHLGGLSSSGLGASDINNYKAVGGISKEFYQRVYAWYSKPEAWKAISREQYFKLNGLIYGGKNDGAAMHWMFEPKVAEQIFVSMIRESGVSVVYNERLQLKTGVNKNKRQIKYIQMESGRRFRGKIFIDATYEGDLMAGAGVSYIVGRESNDEYGESRNGILLNGIVGKDNQTIDPYIVPGQKSSGLLPFIEAKAPGKNGNADNRTQAYCYRFTLSTDTANQLPITKPLNYNPNLYEILARRLQVDSAMQMADILTLTPIPNKKTDTNHGDLPGGSFDWPNGDYATREKLTRLHKDYTLGLVWFCANDKRVPVRIRKQMNQYGFAKDEFMDNDHFPYSIYVREARRMISDYVMTEHDYFGKKIAPEPIGLATYRLDTHTVTYFVDENGKLRSEGVPVKIPANPYAVSYLSIRPRAKECTNLLVPGCLSSSHSAYSSIRMEPVFMIMGQSAGTAAAIAIDENVTVQNVSYDKLKDALLQGKQLLTKEDIK